MFEAQMQNASTKLFTPIVKKSVEQFKGTTPYVCVCGYEYKYDIEVGIKNSLE